MTLSIITINYNNKDGLQKTIESVVKQRVKDFEWIIIDGGSTDGGKELIEENAQHFTYWCSERDKGIYNAMNKGIKVANGDYCLFLNSGDCLYDENVVGNVLKELDGTDFISGDLWFVDDQGNRVKAAIQPDKVTHHHMFLQTLNHQSTFIKTSLLKKRPYDDSLKIAADWEQQFHEIILNGKTYKHINFFISNFLVGGVSGNPEYGKLHMNERKRIMLKHFTQQEIDTTLLKHYASVNNDLSKTRTMQIAYDGIHDSYYTQKLYKETFGPFMHPLPYHHLLRVRLFVWMSLHGLLPLVRTIMKLKK